MRDQEKDFCGDILQDNTDALVWLDCMNDNLSKANKLKTKTYAHWRCVYLVPDRSKEERAAHSKLTTELKQKLGALKEAAEECRPDWSPEWLVQLVRMTLKSFSKGIGTRRGRYLQAVPFVYN